MGSKELPGLKSGVLGNVGHCVVEAAATLIVQSGVHVLTKYLIVTLSLQLL